MPRFDIMYTVARGMRVPNVSEVPTNIGEEELNGYSNARNVKAATKAGLKT